MRDVLGQSWDIPTNWGDLLSRGSHEGCPKTVLGHPCKLGLTRCPEDPLRDVLGQSWDILANWG